jgi:hypothetical protein
MTLTKDNQGIEGGGAPIGQGNRFLDLRNSMQETSLFSGREMRLSAA